MSNHDEERQRITEVTALEWKDLLPSTRKALNKLIGLLAAAVHAKTLKREKSEQLTTENFEQLATSILVSGDRGSGKTTVLLTAMYASCGQKTTNYLKEFIEKKETERKKKEKERQEVKQETERERIDKRLKSLNANIETLTNLNPNIEMLKNGIHWLEPLDLEPVPQKANLLATVLVRIRDALDQQFPALQLHGDGVPSSILEEGVALPWKKVDRLIREATFMWEDVFGINDPRRDRADQQIKAAETLASFQQDLHSCRDGRAQEKASWDVSWLSQIAIL